MRESTTKTIALPEDDPDAFGFFVNWAYTGSISSKLTVMECINTYMLADKLMMVTELFGDNVLLALVDAAQNRREKVTMEHMLVLLESGLTESRLMDLAIQWFAKTVVEDDWEEQPNGEEWVRLLGAEAAVTVKVLGALKKKWQVAATGVEEVDALSVAAQAGSRSTSGASNPSVGLQQSKKTKKRPRDVDEDTVTRPEASRTSRFDVGGGFFTRN